MKNWQLAAGLLLAGVGAVLNWLDIGSPNTSSVLLGAGILIVLWRLLRLRGG